MPFNWLKRITKPSSETSSRSDTPAILSDSLRETPAAAEPVWQQPAESLESPRVEQESSSPRPESATLECNPASPSVCVTNSSCDLEIPSEKIAQRAYEKWVSRGKPIGNPEQDWHEAEQELRQEYQSMTAEQLPHRSR